MANIYAANLEFNLLIFFSLLLGFAISRIGQKAKPIADIFNAFNEIMLKITGWIMCLAPFGVFALMAYTIAVALDSGIFDKVYVVSDSREYLQIAWEYGALCIGEDGQKDWTKSRDYDWMKAAADAGYLKPDDYWMILRPTSPFKTVETIERALVQFRRHGKDVSVRAIRRSSEHPFKSWCVVKFENFPAVYQMIPFIPQSYHGSPRFENQTQNLGLVWIQSATLEIAHASILETGTLSGKWIVPYFCRDHEGID
ncbi:hypothetical protein LCGC14_2997620, partial [marine sediment metagenome]